MVVVMAITIYNITIDPDNLAKMTCIDEVIHLTEDCLSKT